MITRKMDLPRHQAVAGAAQSREYWRHRGPNGDARLSPRGAERLCSRWCGAILLAIVASHFSGRLSAQDLKPPAINAKDDNDHALVLELGAAGDWSRAEGVHPGATFAIEVTPIENWLELEIGFTAIRAEASTEIPVDVLFKKPWRFSRRFEFMVGIGPEIVHATGPDHATFWGLSSVLDFMFWPRKDVGWYVEPGYEVTFRSGTKHHGIGIAAGLLIGR